MKELFARGVTVGMDPANDLALQRGGTARTTLQSFWLSQRCGKCGHSFRLGDEVVIEEDGTVIHREAPFCDTSDSPVEERYSEEAVAFLEALDRAWPPPRNLPVQRLDPGHEFLAPPVHGFSRKTCIVCGHTLRPYDHVVICPCSPDAPLCSTAVHRDPVHRLHCLDIWNPEKLYCPVTSRKLDG